MFHEPPKAHALNAQVVLGAGQHQVPLRVPHAVGAPLLDHEQQPVPFNVADLPSNRLGLEPRAHP